MLGAIRTGLTAAGMRADAGGDPLLNGLVAWYKLDEGAGTLAADSSPSGYDLDTFSNATWDTGLISGGSALAISTGGFVRTTETALPALDFGTGDFSISAFVNLNSLRGVAPANTANTIVSRSYINFEFSVYAGELQFRIGGTDAAITGSASLEINTTYHCCAVRNSGTASVYLNGVFDASISNTASANADGPQKLTVGNRTPNSNSLGLDGIVDDVRIYNRALTQSEITQLAGQ
jgi:hypothetical protein